MTPLFAKPRDGPPLPSLDPSKRCDHHFGVKGHTLEECVHLRHQIQDLINNKLIQFDNMAGLNVSNNPLPPHKETNVNTIFTYESAFVSFLQG